VYLNLSLANMNLHRYEDAVRYTKRALELAGPQPSRFRALGLSLMANEARQTGDLEAALAAAQEARSVADKAEFLDEFDRSGVLYTILWRLGRILGREDTVSLNRPSDALEPLQKAFDLMEEQAAKDPLDSTARDRVATAAEELGNTLRQSDPQRALAIYDRAIQRQRELKSNILARRREAKLLAQSSYALRLLHQAREAGDRIDAAFRLLQATRDYPADKIGLGDEADAVLRASAENAAVKGQTQRAIAIYRELLEKVKSANPAAADDLLQANDLARIYAALSRLYRAAGDVDEGNRVDEFRASLWRGWDAKLPRNAFVQRQVASISAMNR
jgi:tetratricopeptide (TPR) repeat protein